MTHAQNSLALSLASLPDSLRRDALASLSPGALAALKHDWRFWGRPDQITPPGNWRTWLILAGRGWGKTRTGAEWVREQIESGRCGRLALVAPTAADVRDVMVEGESGILAICPDGKRPEYKPSIRRLEWPNGAMATLYSAEEPDRLRGPQHDGAWCDELAAWFYPEAWDMLQMGMRLGNDPRAIVTTTPRPTAIVKRLLADPTTHATRGSTFDNRANLAPAFMDAIIARYQGTRLGRQELYAELLEDVEGALWSRELLDRLRVQSAPELKRVVVAIDPAVTNEADSDETGIVVAGLGMDGHGYILDDLSGRHSPLEWAQRAINAYRTQRADRIVAEVNNGGQLVEVNLRTVDRNVAYKGVHAAKGKRTRAEPIAALYEQGKVHHVGEFARLEDQLCTWNPLDGDKSPDRLDALVWALSEVMLGAAVPSFSLDKLPTRRI